MLKTYDKVRVHNFLGLEPFDAVVFTIMAHPDQSRGVRVLLSADQPQEVKTLTSNIMQRKFILHVDPATLQSTDSQAYLIVI